MLLQNNLELLINYKTQSVFTNSKTYLISAQGCGNEVRRSIAEMLIFCMAVSIPIVTAIFFPCLSAKAIIMPSKPAKAYILLYYNLNTVTILTILLNLG